LEQILPISDQLDTQYPQSAYEKLARSARRSPGFILLTIMELDLSAGLARRSYSSDQDTYPTTGTKPIIINQWFQDVIEAQKPFVANHPDQMGDQFPDLDVIQRIGCGSIVNVPIVKNGKTIAVINILHKEGYFTPSRYAAACALASLL
jgi:hypothetical protein